MSSTVIFPAQPEQILKGLSKLWTSLGQEEKQQGKPTVLRACAMTLIIATDEADGGFAASQTITDLMHEHPGRGIVITVSDKAEHEIEARVTAQCWKPFGKAQQICCEYIEITTRPDSWPKVGPTLVGLTAADLPVVLWCRHRAALSPLATRRQVAGLEAVMNLSTKVIIDTRGEDLETSFDLLADWRAEGRLVADLEWTRLTPWRQPLAQLFDNSARANGLSKFHSVEISHFGEKPTSGVYYIGAWLSAPNRVKVFITKGGGDGTGIKCITLHSDSETIRFERTSEECCTLSSTSGAQRKYSFTDGPLERLMNEELSVTGSDPVFDATFPRAKEILHGRP